jgi:hypothetical protein
LIETSIGLRSAVETEVRTRRFCLNQGFWLNQRFCLNYEVMA